MKRILAVLIILFITSCSDSDNIYYEIKGNEVIYHSVHRKGQEYYTKAHLTAIVVPGANAKTFKQLSKYYGIDSTHVYNKTKQLSRRDPNTFRVITKSITADKYAVYLNNKVVENSHGLSFKFISDDYAIDNHQVYYMSTNFYQIIKGADKNTFEKIGDQFSNYAKDKNRVYFKSNPIKHVNTEYFEILESDYSKDDKRIFYKNNAIEKVDFETFRMLNKEDIKKYNYKIYAEDINHFYGITTSDKNGYSQLKISDKQKSTNDGN